MAASALVFQGRGQLNSPGVLVEAMLALDGQGGRWPGTGDTWIMAVDYECGGRIAFGRPGAPEAPLSAAVVASCSIPGWYEPKEIGGRRYVDGGVCSSTSLDLLSRAELDEVYVLAPMASFELDNPWNPAVRLERVFRRVVDYYSDDPTGKNKGRSEDAFDMRKPLQRDKTRKHVRENGEEHRVGAEDVF